MLDNFYPTSKYLLSNINRENASLLFHKSLEDLYAIIDNVDYGIFIDSGLFLNRVH